MKKLILAYAILLIVFFAGCINTDKVNDDIENGGVTPSKSDEAQVPVERIGNSYGNIINGGYAGFSNGQIYYVKDEESGGLYKANSDWTGEVMITSGGHPQCINIIDNWLYYSDKYEDGIFKIKTDGIGKVRIIEDKTDFINVVGEWIFYSNSSDGDYKSNNRIYKVKIDGTGKRKLTDEMTSNINVVNSQIYYLSWKLQENIYETSLCSISIDGDSRNVISDNCSMFVFNNDNIYYINSKDERLYKLDIPNNRTSVIIDTKVKEFNVNDGWIYYVKNDGLENMYKIGTDGNADVLLSEDRTSTIHIVGDWLFYDSIKAEMPADYYRMKPDGTMKSAVNEDANKDGGDIIHNNYNADYENIEGVKADSFYEDEFIRALIRAKIEAIKDNDVV